MLDLVVNLYLDFTIVSNLSVLSLMIVIIRWGLKEQI